MTAPRRYLTPRQVADYTGAGYSTVLRAMKSGQLRAGQRVAAGCWRADIADVDAWAHGEKPRPRLAQLAERRRA